jgi:hypothetical protein
LRIERDHPSVVDYLSNAGVRTDDLLRLPKILVTEV